MWGSGVFGDSEDPKKIDLQTLLKKENPIHIQNVQLGGSFAVIQDSEDNVYCWGAEYFKEIKIAKESLLTKKVPKKVLSSNDQAKCINAGGQFAFCFKKFRETNPDIEQANTEFEQEEMSLREGDESKSIQPK
jgi:alpha-tubulin suppressor-like RCC1 family protein